ncbi:hypothetical protein [Geomesophilobacter sediminis]|uniref:Uncharacterized protein n=1 Tax=Geomesophilobacter sediminis TaxID=2798584 RepID=A0A8J7JBD4_9BACT|nr:hypothetical protein [Geomesophilobacter sediminis]MBJ6724431.1 hypothetical protein [Geomesophilobacter sediminis]
MAAPAVPFYGKDADRLAMLTIAFNALAQREDILNTWPATVPHPKKFKEKIDIYQGAFHEALNFDRRAIAQRVAACNNAGVTWQKIVNYLCSTEADNTELLQQMGIGSRSRRSTGGPVEVGAPDLSVVNVDEKGGGTGLLLPGPAALHVLHGSNRR